MLDQLQARSPLGTTVDQPARARGSSSDVRLDERRIESAFAIRFNASDPVAASAVSHTTGLPLNGTARVVTAKGTTALALGPGEWLVLPVAGSQVATALAQSGGMPCALIDTSDAWAGVRLSGRHAGYVLSKGCALDVRAHRFPPDSVAVTQLARIRAVIHHVDASPTYDIYVERSYAGYMWSWLEDAMGEFVDSGGRL